MNEQQTGDGHGEALQQVKDYVQHRLDCAARGYGCRFSPTVREPVGTARCIWCKGGPDVHDDGKCRCTCGLDSLLALLAVQSEQSKAVAAELDAWKTGAMADATGHLFRCAKVNGQWSCAPGCAKAVQPLAVQSERTQETEKPNG